ncbi:CAP domain-containing protein [Mucilaginibacter psychrotolerans]|uniref:CAP domain-containing protein n=1 Tax=Mucilaginibacter psychrotolerans TaxID=1524096 RepID=A0A4Y8SKP2_9SPHI|nr:CAP domain-containing protein [Mucilaginibacter psychrotolerans]TFF39639.1 CAP domain-containing protein [Mucilaginibacter psychrotolerans]
MKKPLLKELWLVLFFALAISCKKDTVANFSYDKYYVVSPDIQNCQAGSLNKSSKQAALARVNYIRGLHKLPPVSYNTAGDELVQQSALINAANAVLDHSPDASFACYTSNGAIGSGNSNLGISLSTQVRDFSDDKNVDRWLTEEYSQTIGHRRWLLDPFLKYVAYGRVDGKPKKSNYGFVSAASLKVINDEVADIRYLNVEYVGYPYADYPTALFLKNGYLSFSALYDRLNEWNNSYIKYNTAVIEVTTDNGQQLRVSSISYDNDSEGLPNSIQWKTEGLKDNINYNVNIKNIQADGQTLSYKYSFKLVK